MLCSTHIQEFDFPFYYHVTFDSFAELNIYEHTSYLCGDGEDKSCTKTRYSEEIFAISIQPFITFYPLLNNLPEEMIQLFLSALRLKFLV